jgi:HSP20 family molecular chaperone IbpA
MVAEAPLIDYWAIPTFKPAKRLPTVVYDADKDRENDGSTWGVPIDGPRPAAGPEQLAQKEEYAPMSRLSLFNSPFLLGFDQFEQALDRVSKASNDGYPPYNIEQTSDNVLRISLAVAGFTMDDLSITVEGNQLIIRGKQTDDKDKVYLHRGIAARQFQRSFVLAEGIEVTGAWLDSGLLNIDLERPTVEDRVRTVEIRDGLASGTRRKAATIDVTTEKVAE